MSQAVLQAQEELGSPNFKAYCTTFNREDVAYIYKNECRQLVLKQLKFSGQTCNYDRNEIYIYNKKQKGAYIDIGATAYPSYGLPDGSCVDVMINAGTFGVSVDINGYKKGPNALGHDIFSFWVNDSGALVPIKASSYKNDDELANLINACGTDDYKGNACASGANQSGFPCSVKSNQKGNGIGCSWFAMNDVSPDDPAKSYWESLPR